MLNRRLTEFSEDVQPAKLYNGFQLACPRCGGGYLHHDKVVVYDRCNGEDGKTTAVSTVWNGLTATHLLPSSESGNPSGRRDGIAIALSCENCGPDIELTIVQHKGCTELAWRFADHGKELWRGPL